MWTLPNISSEEYDRIYKGTSAMQQKHLFESEPDSDEDALSNYFISKLWRINSGIYKIEDKDGNLIEFKMNWAQHVVYGESLRHPRLIILKSRQQGISTFWLIYFFDESLVGDNYKFGLMAQGLDEAATLKERIERAYDNIPVELLQFLGVTNTVRNSKEFSLDNDCKIYIATSFRSGTLQGLHISEFGKIASKNPEKAKETKTGSMQAIRGGLPVIIESTAEGRANMFYTQWQLTQSHTGPLAPKDFLPVFLSWVNDPDCRINVPQLVDEEAEQYFAELHLEYAKYFLTELTLCDEQRWWWVSQFREFAYSKDMMGQEYPGWPEEAFAATKDGTYYAKLFRKYVIARNRVVEDLYEPALPVEVAIDLGMNDTMVLVYAQVYREELRIIDVYHNSGEGILHYVNKMRETGYRISKVWLPHDASVREMGTGKSRFAIFHGLGVPVRLLPRTRSVPNDIELVRHAIPYMYLDAKHTKYLRDMFENYAKEWDDRLGVFKDKPLHDDWSNPADAVRYLVVANFHRIRRAGASARPREGGKKGRRGGSVVDGLNMG